MLEFNLEPELSLSAGVSAKVLQFSVDLSKLMFLKILCLMFFFGISTLTGLSTFITEVDLLLYLPL